MDIEKQEFDPAQVQVSLVQLLIKKKQYEPSLIVGDIS